MTAARGRAGTLRAHFETLRPYTLWYIGLVGLAGAGLTGSHPGWVRLADAWAVPTLGWIGAHYLGDYFDRSLDAIAKPQRPIPSGRLSPAAAAACGSSCLAAAALLAVAAGWATGLAALAAAGGAICYSRWLKANGVSGNLTRGALGALTLVYGALAAAPGEPRIGWALLPFALAFWAHDTASNLVGAMRDVAGDRAGGYQTVPVRRGYRPAAWTALLVYCAAGLASLAGGLLGVGRAAAHPAPARFTVLLAAAAGLGAVAFLALFRQRGQPGQRAALRAHEVLVLERLVFAAAPISLGLGVATAASMLGPALALSWLAQVRMRAAFELGPAADGQTMSQEPPAQPPGPYRALGVD